MRAVRSSTRYPKRKLVAKAAPTAPKAKAPKATKKKRKAASIAAPSKKKARKNLPAVTGYKKLVLDAVASAPRGGAAYSHIHAQVQGAKENANRSYVTKAVRALLEAGHIEPTKRHKRKFVVASAPAKKTTKKKSAPAKKTTKKKSAAAKKKSTKKSAPAKKKTQKKKAAKKSAPKKAASKVPSVSGYQKLALDAVASAPRGGMTHTQIHAAVKATRENANKTFITKAVRALAAAGYILPTKRHQRKFVAAHKTKAK